MFTKSIHFVTHKQLQWLTFYPSNSRSLINYRSLYATNKCWPASRMTAKNLTIFVTWRKKNGRASNSAISCWVNSVLSVAGDLSSVAAAFAVSLPADISMVSAWRRVQFTYVELHHDRPTCTLCLKNAPTLKKYSQNYNDRYWCNLAEIFKRL